MRTSEKNGFIIEHRYAVFIMAGIAIAGGEFFLDILRIAGRRVAASRSMAGLATQVFEIGRLGFRFEPSRFPVTGGMAFVAFFDLFAGQTLFHQDNALEGVTHLRMAGKTGMLLFMAPLADLRPDVGL